ncbi:MAG: hypothetical protein US50_C0031G0003 [Candidatus Nomurabacteria bacterium GW2011_GWB1_37_5]|uniref:Transmembrane protein n=1 Tax=Candidatus Nomurabacteria bacterium GW2011_GWB1_37_5 TaxID=1618742 RepID=A0A0G0GV65_9BACT|nr:MAG: hypothetical protein US50_C0031G0003 [Candidatus Nomurabacteria bacterium GW2011_GWB1_37_5]
MKKYLHILILILFLPLFFASAKKVECCTPPVPGYGVYGNDCAPLLQEEGIVDTCVTTLMSTGAVIYNIISITLWILMSLAIIYFIWGVTQYMMAKEDKDKTAAKGMMIYGTIGLFVIFSALGLVAILKNTFVSGDGTVSMDNCKGYTITMKVGDDIITKTTNPCPAGQNLIGCTELSFPVCQ